MTRKKKASSDTHHAPHSFPSEPVQPGKGEARLLAWLTPRREMLILLCLLAAGAGLRGAYLHEIRQQPDFDMPMLDPAFHDYWARCLASGNWAPPALNPDPHIQTTPYGRPPVYPYFLALIYKFSGSSYLAARVVQMGLGLVNALLLWGLVRRLFGKVAGLAAAGLMSFYWVFIYYEGQLEGPVLEITCLLLFFHVVWRWAVRPGISYAALAGAISGLFVLLRPNALLLAPVLAAWTIWVLWRRRESLRQAVLTVLAAGLCAAAVIAPVTIRNYRASGEFFLVTYTGPVNFYAGNNPFADATSPAIPDLMELTGTRMWTGFHYPGIVAGIARKMGKETITYKEAGQYFSRKAKTDIREHPRETLGRIFKRAFLFWGPVEVTSNDVTQYSKTMSPVLRFLPGFAWAMALMLLSVGLLAADRWKRHALTPGVSGPGTPSSDAVVEICVLIGLWMIAYSVTFLPFIVSCRYRTPVIPLLFIFGAYGAARAAGWAAARDYPKVAASSVALLVLYGLCRIQVYPYDPEVDYWFVSRGAALRIKGNLDEAADCFEKALAVPNQTSGILPKLFLAEIRAQQDRREESTKLFSEAIKTDKALTLAYFDKLFTPGTTPPLIPPAFARTLEGMDKADLAEKIYRADLVHNPADLEAMEGLAHVLDQKGQHGDAIQQRIILGVTLINQGNAGPGTEMLQKAMEVDPEAARMALARLVGEFAQGVDKAVNTQAFGEPFAQALDALKLTDLAEQYRAAVAKRPASPEAQASEKVASGSALLKQGNVEGAAKEYEAALALDPHHKGAHSCLGTVLVYQGKLEDALVHFKKALEADPSDGRVKKLIADTLERLGRAHEAEAYRK